MRRCIRCSKFLTHHCPLKVRPEPDDCACREFVSHEDEGYNQAEINQELRRERNEKGY
jgi:hypothetical protein